MSEANTVPMTAEHLAELYRTDHLITTHPPKGPCRAHALLAKHRLDPACAEAWELLIGKGYSFTVRAADPEPQPFTFTTDRDRGC